jgi:transcriptional regulator with XRE-family HTH domain
VDAFQTQLRHYRLAAGLTQEALAERAGLSTRGIQNLERGERRPYADTTQRLIAALQLEGREQRRVANRRIRRRRFEPAHAADELSRP